MANIAKVAAEALVEYLEERVPTMAGKIHPVAPGPNHKAEFPCVSIIMRRLRFQPQQAELVYEEEDTPGVGDDDPTPGAILWNVGSFEGLAEVRVYASSVPQREQIESLVLNALLGEPSSPGVVSLQLEEIQVGDVLTDYEAPISFTLADSEWKEEFAFENRRFSFIDVDAVLPVLLADSAYTLEQLQIGLNDDLESDVPTFEIAVDEDGNTSIP